MNIDCEVSALLAVAMNAQSKTRKAAALALIEALRTGIETDQFPTIATKAEQTHGSGVAAEVLTLAREQGLS